MKMILTKSALNWPFLVYNTPTMSTISNLETQAVTAAKKGDWQAAIDYNDQILQTQPDNIGALNRAGFAYLQMKNFTQARDHFEKVLSLEKNNPIATKQLQNIRSQTVATPQFGSIDFVEEPSKSKIIGLLRLADKHVLEGLSIGQELQLHPKGRFITIETTDKRYLGSLPEDISLRLSKLIERGNRYLCQVHSASSKHVRVFIKETYQSPANVNYHSFPTSFQSADQDNIGEDLLLLADETPLNLSDEEDQLNDDSFNK